MKVWPSRLLVVLAIGVTWCAGSSAASAETAPVIERQSVSDLSPTDARLEADIDPGGLETEYRFHLEYECGLWGEGCPTVCSPDPWWERCVAPIHVQLPIGEIPASSDNTGVSVYVSQAGVTLHPGTEHFFWVEATNSAGTSRGPTHGFTTPGASAPLIDSVSVSSISATNATLEARINPGGLIASYDFHLVVGWLCEETFPPCEHMVEAITLPGGQLPASSKSQSVSLDLNEAGVTLSGFHNYSFSVRATNLLGSAQQSGGMFTAAPLVPEDGPAAGGPFAQPPSMSRPIGTDPPSASGRRVKSSRKAPHCGRRFRRHPPHRHRHRRLGIANACRWG